MAEISVPDLIAPTIQHFVNHLIENGLDRLTWGQYLDGGLKYVQKENNSLSARPHQDCSEVALTDRLRVVLQLSGEAFLSPAGLEVSDRVLKWCLNALAKQADMSMEEVETKILNETSDNDRFWLFMQLLDDAPLEALIQILEKEIKNKR